MPARVRSLLLLVGFITASLGARDARAYVRSLSTVPGMQGNPLYWSTSCETVTVYLNGFSEMTPDEVAKSIGAAAAAWGPDAVTCPGASGSGGGHPSFQIIAQMAAPGAPAPAIANDGQNAIVFETTTWGSDLPPDALAYTKVYKEPSGHIVEADIAINAVPGMPGPLANLDPGVPPPTHGQLRFDLQTVMTHEFGHFLGLGHTCKSDSYTGGDDSGDPTSGLDDQGQPIPTCATYPPASEATEAAAVMWFEVASESISKRVLTADDARGVCAIYPATAAAPACTLNTPDDGCGCAAAGATPVPATSAAALALALGALRRRRRARRQCPGH